MLDLKKLPNLTADEKIVHVLRRHPLTLAALVVGYVVLLAMPVIGWWALKNYAPGILIHPYWFPLIVLVSSFVFLFIWLFLFQSFMDYHLDIWVVTTQRIMNIKQLGLFSRRVSELRLYRIQDVTATVTGVFHTLFDYGDVEIQTAGEQERFNVEDIPRPNDVTKSILGLAETERRKNLETAVEEFEGPEHGAKQG